MLGAALLERTTRVVGLTEAGRWLLREIEKPLDQIDQIMNRTRRIHLGTAGELRVGFNDFAMNGHLPEIVRDFRARIPEVDVLLQDHTTPQMIELILEGELDVAFHTGPYHHRQLGSFPVRHERLVCVMPSSHPLAELKVIPLKELQSEPFVLGDPETWRIFHRLLRDFCLRHGFDLRVAQHAVHSDGIMALVAAGIGVTLHVDADWIRHRQGVTVRSLKEPHPQITTQATWRRDRAGSNRILSQFLESTRHIANSD